MMTSTTSAFPPLPPLPPIPVQPLTYGSPVSRRPGLITAIGVISIVVASLTMLGAVVQGFQTLVMFSMARMTTAMAAASASSAAGAEELSPYPAEAGIADVDERQAILRGLERAQRLAPARREQLDALLQAGGREMFLLRGPQLTVETVAANVSDSGQKYADDGNGAHFFIVGQGEIEVYDDHAVFYPRDGGELISASAAEANAPIGPTTSDDTQPPVVSPGGGAGTAVAGNNPSTVPVTAPLPTFQVSTFWLVLLMVERLLSVGLAIYLLVIGILVLRQSPRGRRLHRIYAIAKIPLAVIGGWATWRLWATFFAGMGAGAPANSVWGVWILLLTLLAVAYPIGLLIALSSRTAREYYDSVQPEALASY